MNPVWSKACDATTSTPFLITRSGQILQLLYQLGMTAG